MAQGASDTFLDGEKATGVVDSILTKCRVPPTHKLCENMRLGKLIPFLSLPLFFSFLLHSFPLPLIYEVLKTSCYLMVYKKSDILSQGKFNLPRAKVPDQVLIPTILLHTFFWRMGQGTFSYNM